MADAAALTEVNVDNAEIPSPTEMSSEQYDHWRRTGEVFGPPKEKGKASEHSKTEDDDDEQRTSESLTEKESSGAAAEHAAAEAAPASEAGKLQDQRKRSNAQDRIRQLVDENKTFKQRLEALEREKSAPEKRDTPQASQPAPDKYTRLDEKKYFTENPKATYEEYLAAAIEDRATFEQKQTDQKIANALAADRQQRAQEAASKTVTEKVNDAKGRYPDFSEKFEPALKAIAGDPKIPLAIKAMLEDSPVLVDLVYVLGTDSSELAKFVELAKTNPGAAIRKLVTTEALVEEKLKGKAADSTRERGEDGKFVPSKTPEKKITQAPPPSREVGGTGSAATDEVEKAVQDDDFERFRAADNARKLARARRGK